VAFQEMYHTVPVAEVALGDLDAFELLVPATHIHAGRPTFSPLRLTAAFGGGQIEV